MTAPQPSYRTIPLTKGYDAIVDASDHEWLSGFKWIASCGRNTVYAIRPVKTDEGWRNIRMHREILGVSDPRILIDHVDRDGLHNWRNNLRPSSHAQNLANSPLRCTNTSGYRGVSPKNRGWEARVESNGKRIHLGVYPSREDAAMAYDAKAIELWGDFAALNFPSAERKQP